MTCGLEGPRLVGTQGGVWGTMVMNVPHLETLELRLRGSKDKAEEQGGATPIVFQMNSLEGGGLIPIWSQPVCFDGQNIVKLVFVW